MVTRRDSREEMTPSSRVHLITYFDAAAGLFPPFLQGVVYNCSVFHANFSGGNFVHLNSQSWGSDLSYIWQVDRCIIGASKVDYEF